MSPRQGQQGQKDMASKYRNVVDVENAGVSHQPAASRPVRLPNYQTPQNHDVIVLVYACSSLLHTCRTTDNTAAILGIKYNLDSLLDITA
jgi:hypothetical protein